MRTIKTIKRDLDKSMKLGGSFHTRGFEEELCKAIKGDISFDRLEQICNAEREGKCEILACKLGQVVYGLIDGAIVELEVVKIELYVLEETQYYTIGNGDIESAMTLDFNADDIGKTIFASYELAAEKQKKG